MAYRMHAGGDMSSGVRPGTCSLTTRSSGLRPRVGTRNILWGSFRSQDRIRTLVWNECRQGVVRVKPKAMSTDHQGLR